MFKVASTDLWRNLCCIVSNMSDIGMLIIYKNLFSTSASEKFLDGLKI